MEKYRELTGLSLKVWKSALIFISVLGILYILGVYQYFGLQIYKAQYVGLFFALIFFVIFLGVPSRKDRVETTVPWYDWILALVSLVVGLYLFILYPRIVYEFYYVTPDRVAIGILAVLLILEALRRLTGWILVAVVLIFISYAYIAPYLFGTLRGNPTDTAKLFNYLYFDTSGIISMLGVAVTLGFAFILFGQVLLQLRGGDILNNIAIYGFGRFRGGTAKAAIVGSSLAGTITGGPVTNVIMTGTITIPLMKKSGYKPELAGAVESVASTGGQIMPPVMGVAAFVMAEYLGVPYSEIALAALIPAILYYFSLFVQVHFLAIKDGYRGLSKEELPKRSELRTAILIVPAFAILIYFMFIKGYTAQIAALYSAAVAFIFLAFQESIRKELWFNIKQIFIDTSKTLITITVVLAAAGIVVGVTGITGLGFNLALTLSGIAEHGLFWLLFVSAVVSFILGMGMPSVAAYTLVAVLVAPAMVDMGINPIAAHMFVFYFSILCNYTPPIAMACFAAAPIAKASPIKIGIEAVKLGVVGFIVPFIFIYDPRLLITVNYEYGLIDFVVSLLFAMSACVFLALGLVGTWFKEISTLKRVLFVILSILIFVPINIMGTPYILNAASFGVGVLILAIDFTRSRLNKADAGVLAKQE